MRITFLKFWTYVNYILNVYFLRITNIKVSKYIHSRPNHKIPTTSHKIPATKIIKIILFDLNVIDFDILIISTRKN